MTTSSLYQQILNEIDQLNDKELTALSKFIQELIAVRKHIAEYDPETDPVNTGEGLFEGPQDLSSRVKEILYGENPSNE